MTVDTTGDLAITHQALSQLGSSVVSPQTEQEPATKEDRPSSLKARVRHIRKTRPYWVLGVGMILMLVLGVLIPLPPYFRGPLVDINDGILIAVLVAISAFVAQLYVDRGQLLLRMGKLEDSVTDFREENDDLRSDLRAATSFIDSVGLWIVGGMHPSLRPSPPKRLENQINSTLWAKTTFGEASPLLQSSPGTEEPE